MEVFLWSNSGRQNLNSHANSVVCELQVDVHPNNLILMP